MTGQKCRRILNVAIFANVQAAFLSCLHPLVQQGPSYPSGLQIECVLPCVLPQRNLLLEA